MDPSVRTSLVLLLVAFSVQPGGVRGETLAAQPHLEPADWLPPAPPQRAWKLIWHDEFEGQTLDETKWTVPEHKCRDAWWTRKALELDGQGHLIIRAIKEGDQYYDAGIHTRDKFEHTFGYYVARMRLQKKAGHWSAFWLWNRGMKHFRERFEIDIMERPWLDERIQHTFHWGGEGADHKSSGHVARVPGVHEGWHTFALLWTPEQYVFYVDGQATWQPRDVPVWREPLYILVTDEIEFTGWAGDIRTSILPDEFQVDYVRVYDLVELPSEPRP